MFYDKYLSLCKAKGVSPSRAAEDAGFAKSLVTKWRTNKIEIPSADILNKVSSYFHVPVSELLGEYEETKKDPSEPQLTGIDKELYDLIKLIPEEQKKAFLAMGHAYVSNLSKD